MWGYEALRVSSVEVGTGFAAAVRESEVMGCVIL